MRRVYGFAGLVLLAACLAVSCGKMWRIDPPEVLSGSVWKGTNDARGDVLYFCYYDSEVTSYEAKTKKTGTKEDGKVDLYFITGADTVKYTGTFTYYRYPAYYVVEIYGDVSLTLKNTETGVPREGYMKHSDTHFYFHFRDEQRGYPTLEYTGDMSVIDSLRK